MSRNKQPTALAKVRQNELAKILEDVARDDLFVVQAGTRGLRSFTSTDEALALLALPDKELTAKGWTREELRIAFHTLKNSKEAPTGLKFANDRVLMRWRDGSGEKPSSGAAPTFVLPVVGIVQQQPVKIIDVKAEPKK